MSAQFGPKKWKKGVHRFGPTVVWFGPLSKCIFKNAIQNSRFGPRNAYYGPRNAYFSPRNAYFGPCFIRFGPVECRLENTWLLNFVWKVSSWSVFTQQQQTSNDVEGWHHCLNTYCSQQINVRGVNMYLWWRCLLRRLQQYQWEPPCSSRGTTYAFKETATLSLTKNSSTSGKATRKNDEALWFSKDLGEQLNRTLQKKKGESFTASGPKPN